MDEDPTIDLQTGMYVPPVVEGVVWEDMPVTMHGPKRERVWMGRKVLKRPKPSINQRAGTSREWVRVGVIKDIAQVMPGEGEWWPHIPEECCGDHKSVWMFDQQLLICQGCGLDCT